MKRIRSWVYRHGFRPKFGSIFFSPSLHLIYTGWGANLNRTMRGFETPDEIRRLLERELESE